MSRNQLQFEISWAHCRPIRAIQRPAFVFLTAVLVLLPLSASIPAPTNTVARPKIGLVLSGGGAEGFAHGSIPSNPEVQRMIIENL